MADEILITYQFDFDDGKQTKFVVRLDPHTLDHIYEPPENPPAWVRIEAGQCRTCPLAEDKNHLCPVALSLVELVEGFRDVLSYSEVAVTVTTPERTVLKRTTVQKALSSLVGLHMATSGCPNMAFLKPLARFHLPFATREETVYRVVSTYLLGQYIIASNGGRADLKLAGLQRAYERLHEVNVELAQRLRYTSTGDAHINAVILLDLFAQELPSAISEHLKQIAFLFQEFPEAQETFLEACDAQG